MKLRQTSLPLGVAVLTPRERQVIEARARGLSYKLLAVDLSMSPLNARQHAHRIFCKLGVCSTLEALAILAGI